MFKSEQHMFGPLYLRKYNSVHFSLAYSTNLLSLLLLQEVGRDLGPMHASNNNNNFFTMVKNESEALLSTTDRDIV